MSLRINDPFINYCGSSWNLWQLPPR